MTRPLGAAAPDPDQVGSARVGPVARQSCQVEVSGTVQGVGFRPYVYRLAGALGLTGTVRNADGRVVIEATGDPAQLAALVRRLPAEAPPRAVVTRVTVTRRDGVPAGAGAGGDGTPSASPTTGFRVLESSVGAVPGADRDVPPDLATCDRCRDELFDPADRRFRYPFINCTDCGPRASIIDTLPYDRARTTMARFPLCPACAAEYADPGDRRFHAEPVACPTCGPRLAWRPTGARSPAAAAESALAAAVATIAAGGLVAVKGLAGYQLVCDAGRADAVAHLRERKRRPAKPFAVMVPDLSWARKLARTTPAEEALLASVAGPIVLLPVADSGWLAPAVAPGTDRIGLFLPATGLHHLLLHDLARPLVVTSGNRGDEPIAIDDDDAYRRLAELVDGVLSHDRPIRARFDDPVAAVVAGRPAVIRRARGYAPAPLRLPRPARRPLLAVGAQLKHTFAVADRDRVVLGPHGGDLADADTFDAFEAGLAHLTRLVGVTPETVVHDLHPGYLSTRYASRFPAADRLPVQHHHAHIASCLAEHGLTGPAIGVAYDGLGYGADGTLWGGEILAADLTGFRRLGRFGRAPLPGGEAAVRRPARMALGYLYGAERLDPPGPAGPAYADRYPQLDPSVTGLFTDRLPEREVRVVRTLIARGVNCPQASSAGRLFDAVAGLLAVADEVSFEGEAAVRLEAVARPAVEVAGWGRIAELPWRLTTRDGLAVYDPWPTLAAVAAGYTDGRSTAELAAAFHATLVAVTAALCERARAATGLTTVCLSGGVFQNQLLTEGLRAALRSAGFDVYGNEQVPTTDGGISYGQAAVAAARSGG